VNAGFDKDRVFSHQLIPTLNGSWNDMLFAAQASLSPASPYLPGMTVYGGSTFTPALIKKAAGRRYGLPEFHPLQHKDDDIPEAILRYHYAHGAVFITPYFMSIRNEHQKGQAAHDRMLITPTNTERGSDNLYRAIKKLAFE
jgi:hypothetical protein